MSGVPGAPSAATETQPALGLVGAVAPASRYATVYAKHCVVARLDPLLLAQSDDMIASALASYELPCTADEGSRARVPEIIVPASDGPDADVGEVWAAEPDEDDVAYEPLEAQDRRRAS